MLLNKIDMSGVGALPKTVIRDGPETYEIIYFDYNIMFTIVLFIFLVKHVLAFTYTLTDFYCQIYVSNPGPYT